MHTSSEAALPTRYSIATITCDQFAIGTEILLYSVLKYNRWFNGDINIVIADLSAQNRARLQAIYPVKFIHASPELTERVELLRRRHAYLRDIHLRFYSLEAFNLPQYDKVVYLDSDMYCAGDIRPLFLSAAPLQACLDGYSYEDRIAPVVAATGLVLPLAAERYGKSFNDSVNAGVIAITPAALPQFRYANLLDMLDCDAWAGYGASLFTDQMVINRFFENQFERLTSRYNYMIFLGSYLSFVDGVEPEQAAIVHFAGKIKPWNNYDPAALLRSAPHYLPFILRWRALLQEARSADLAKFQAEQVLRQYQWIETQADAQLTALDRLF